jgi:thioredoxin-like negative regulator of GroEL
MRRGALFGGLAVALVAVGVALFLLVRPTSPSVPGFERLIEGVDQALAGGYLSTARENLAGLRSLPASESDLLRLLKRAFAVGSGTGDFSLLADLGTRAISMAPRSATIHSIAAYGLLRAGRLADAENSLARGGSAIATLLSGEMTLRRGAPWKGSDSLTRDLLALESDRSSSSFSSAALRTGDERLSLDAALLAMGEGNVREAWSIVRDGLSGARFDEPAAMILYDEGDASAALTRLRRVESSGPGGAAIELVMADVLRANGKTEEAETSIAHALSRAPSLSWTPYADLAFFALQRGDRAGADRKLTDGLAFFPNARPLLLARARLAAGMGRTADAIAILERLVVSDPGDGEAGLLLVALQSAEMTPEGYRARLWRLFDRLPANGNVFRTLTDALIASHDWEGAGIALKQYQAASGAKDGDTLLVAGVIASQAGSSLDAEALLRQAADAAKDGKARYDLALLSIEKNDPQAALQDLQSASDEISVNGDPTEARTLQSRIEMLRGFAHALDGDFTDARSALARAVVADGHNLRASLLLRKLAAGGQ